MNKINNESKKTIYIKNMESLILAQDERWRYA